MGRTVDVEDLIDAGEIADLLGLAGRKSFASMRAQKLGPWRDFPAPVIDRLPCKFWVRQDIETWDAARRTEGGAADEPA